MDLDEIDDIRIRIYDLRDELDKHIRHQISCHSLRTLRHYIDVSTEYADDLRVDLMDEADELPVNPEFQTGE